MVSTNLSYLYCLLDVEYLVTPFPKFSGLSGEYTRTNYSTNWSFVSVMILSLAVAGVAGYALYKYRIRVSL